MRILLFGGSGQLGYELRKRCADLHFDVVSPVTKEVDITDVSQVDTLIHALKPTIVINSAAYTAVDKAEEEPEKAFAINADGVSSIAKACSRTGARLIHLSTDYVFDGTLGRPISEDDPVNPISVYGRSKLAGEVFVSDILGEAGLVVRTQALYGQKGVNFVHTMLKLFAEREVLKIVDDQWVSPTWAGWLAEVVLDLARIPTHGVVHASCSGVVSWFDFAAEIHRMAEKSFEGRPMAKLERTTAAELNRPARRPIYSAFNNSRLATIVGRHSISWQDGLAIFLHELGIV